MLALDELADLAAQRTEHIEKLLVRLPDFAAEELHNANHCAGHCDREPERRSQALFRGDRRTWKIRILSDIGDPCRLRQFPHSPRHTFAPRKNMSAGSHLELVCAGVRSLPDFDTAQPVLFYHPERSHAPLERLAEGPQNVRGGISQRRVLR